MVGNNMEQLTKDYPIGTVITEYVHGDDNGALRVSGYGTIHSVYVVVVQCDGCGRKFDASDTDALTPTDT